MFPDVWNFRSEPRSKQLNEIDFDSDLEKLLASCDRNNF